LRTKSLVGETLGFGPNDDMMEHARNVASKGTTCTVGLGCGTTRGEGDEYVEGGLGVDSSTGLPATVTEGCDDDNEAVAGSDGCAVTKKMKSSWAVCSAWTRDATIGDGLGAGLCGFVDGNGHGVARRNFVDGVLVVEVLEDVEEGGAVSWATDASTGHGMCGVEGETTTVAENKSI